MKFILFALTISGMILNIAVATPSKAGGFSGSGGTAAYGAGNSTTSVKVKSKYSNYKSKTHANAEVKVLYGGKIAIGNANAGNVSSYTAKGKSKYQQWKSSKAKVYAKGGNVMAKARSENKVTIVAAGKTYVVSKEVARAMARFTPLGTTAAAESTAYVGAASSGYLGVKTATQNSATVRVRR